MVPLEIKVTLMCEIRVDSGVISVPDVAGNLGDGVAGGNVDFLDLKEGGDAVARLGIDNVGAHVLAEDMVRAISDLRSQYAGVVRAEDVLEGNKMALSLGPASLWLTASQAVTSSAS
ncbi:hypothetical protein CORC01_08480 [Colletotrichum orchidophilum]|uniref:Uncharacterized protein n=1 Tax=Colletotrichum orchidophilum TaxID=1209926 RepID=A0A1G4B4Q8_9PEZI|nr:uncharacterized protein CORC01_08480 [Colletotrichum orchidophilum]OHE96262.1 hypothetical protein CORC01_08480 [Colletotrichum orchidophilum]